MNDDLTRRLRAADPAADLPPTGPDQLSRLLEDTMDDPTTPTGTRRTLLPWLAVAAAVVLVTVLAIQTVDNEATPVATDSATPSSSASPSSTPTESPADDGTTTQTLTVGETGETAGRCLPPTAQNLAPATTAFAGEVTVLESGLATLTVDTWYAGDETDDVVVRAPSEDMQALLGAVSFEEGGRYLVAANDDGSVMLCGFSGPDDDSRAAMYAEAFGG